MLGFVEAKTGKHMETGKFLWYTIHSIYYVLCALTVVTVLQLTSVDSLRLVIYEPLWANKDN